MYQTMIERRKSFSKIKAEMLKRVNTISKQIFSDSKIILERNQSDQARKSVGRMTWHQEPTKDVTSCEKPRLGANIHRPADVRMGKPTEAIPQYRIVNP